VSSEWGVSDQNRQAKFYQLTRAGEKQLARETETWAQISAAVTRIVDA
jgi:PadR family transcriptional regulator PadR